MNRAEHVAEREAPWRRYGPDLLIVVVLLVAAFLARRGGLPTDGLWLDDAIVGGGLEPPLSELLAVSFDHPGYTVALSAWAALTGGGAASLAYPALVAGALGPPLLFVALREFGYERAISMLIAAVLVGAEANIVYSGRLKTYVIDLLIVVALALIVPRLAGMSWRWRTAAAWAVSAVVVASFSSFTLVAIVVAGFTIVIHPASDLRVRLVAVGASTITSLALLLFELRTYDSGPIEEQWRDLWDAFPAFGADILEHFRRLAETFTNAPPWLASICIVVAVTGLVVSATRGEGRVRARYLLLLLGAALVGGLMGKFPFGPQEGEPLSTGERATLWILPVVAIGLAASLHLLRARLPAIRPLRFGFDLAAYVGAAVLIVTAGPALAYPFPGPSSASDFIETTLGPEDSLLLPSRSNWSFAADSSFASEPRATPESSIGYVPEFEDARIHDIASYVEGGPVDSAIRGADRVLVYYPAKAFSEAEADTRQQLATYLSDRRWVSEVVPFGSATVEVWDREAGDVSPADLPAGWSGTPTPSDPTLFDCLGVPTEGATQSTVTAVPPDSDGKLFVLSTTTRWPSPADAQAAQRALAGDEALDCVGESLEATLSTINLPARVDARRVMPPEGSGASTVAFTQAIQVTDGSSPFAPVALVYLSDGVDSVLINGFSLGEKPFPPDLLRRFVESAAD